MSNFFYPQIKYLLVIFLIFPLYLKAQNNYLASKSVILPSPNVAAIQRYGTWPLGGFTGTAPVSIPLFEVKSGELSLPVALSYNSGGVRVNDVGSEVGIGWALNAGGVINRTMMGGQVDDNIVNGFWEKYPVTMPVADPYSEYERVNMYSSGRLDAQPDLFSYSVAGMNGKFVFDHLKNIYQIPYTSNSIVPVIRNYPNSYTGTEVGNAIVSFTITDENGTQYEFSTPELSITTPYTYLDGSSTPEPGDDLIRVSASYIFTWQLTNIISASKKDTISFVYEPVDTYYWTSGSSEIHAAKQFEGNIAPMLPPYQKIRTNLKNQPQTQRIKFIKFNGGYLQFYGNTDRRDMQQGKRLDSIVLYNAKNGKIKSYSFNYQYLYNTSLYTDAQVPVAAEKEELRMMLNSIRETGTNGNSLPPYLFTYEHSKALPSRLLSGGDVWGFANGKVYKEIGDSLVGKGYDGFYDYTKDLLRLKRPDYTYASQGSLTGIQYPTGGSTTFVYEPHFREPTADSTAIQVCDGNINTNFTGVQFAPTIPNDPDAPPPPKFRVSVNNSGIDVVTSLDSRYNNFPSYYYIEIRDSATNNLIYTYKNGSLFCDSYSSTPYPTCNKHLTLNIGTYYIYAKNTGQTYPGSAGDIFCNMKILPFNCHTEYVIVRDSIAVGGIRLKSVMDIDSATGNKILREYEYSNGVRPPWTGVYNFEKEMNYHVVGSGGQGNYKSVENERIISSSSLYPILDMMGGFIGYGSVKETQRDLNTGVSNGYTISYFDNNIDDSPGAENYKIIPYPPFTGNSWTYGRLLRKSVYKGQGTGAAIVSDEKKSYSPLKNKGTASGEAFFTSRYIRINSNYPFWSNDHHEYVLQEYFKHATFKYSSAYSTLDSTVVTTYDDNGGVNIVKEQYEYDTTTTLIKQSKKTDSKGDLMITNILRAPDYGSLSATDATTAGIKLLQQRHVYAPEIEISNFKANADGSNSRFLSSYFFSFRQDQPWKNKVFNLQSDVPITNFTASRNLSGAVTKDGRYTERISFSSYDASGNLTEQQKTNDVKESYLWGYGGLYPVARIIGAEYDTAKKYINQNILDNPTNDVQLRTELTNLRTKLPGALVTTYTYGLLLGMTSETDPSGKTIFYEYDDLGRLRLIKDQDGKIVKQFNYQYQQPVTQ
ncbi:hypothetical protein ACTJJ0_13085 [Chitinophaga sp. 22321]|uniref:YD repeat-containing protein n=1 Tax=Chitinophaga hostae TaxID=2831022 RepID=A0ABS5J141_9BACT|nr:hypothetical protein [Chitinophaga hostae]MBS0028875.1 hypothetical protein [Chitinophaga hostae]